MVRALELKSGGSGFKSRSDRYLELFLGSPEFNSSDILVNNQLVCLLPAGILNHVTYVMFENYLFLPVCFITPQKPVLGRG